MNTEIYIEGQLADIIADVSALFTYTIDDVTDIAMRDTGFSKTIVFPGTGINNILFGNAFEFSAYSPYDPNHANIGANFNAAKSAQCVVLVHGIQVFKGILRLMEVKMLNGNIEYEAAIFGELGGLMGAIGNRLLTGNTDTAGQVNISDDLDFSDYNQNWNHANIIQTWADLATTGYRGYGIYYPLIDYGLCTLNRIDFCYQAMRPALYVHEYLVKIFDKTGYTFYCPFFETPFFLRLIIPHNEDVIYKMVRMLVDHRSLPPGGPIVFASNPGVVEDLSSPAVFGSSVTLVNFTVGGLGSSFTYTAGSPTIPATITVPLSFRSTGGQTQVLITVTLLKNGSPIDTETFILTAPGPTITRHNNVTLEVIGQDITAGDIFAVGVTASYPGLTPAQPWEVFLDAGRITIEAAYAIATPAGYNDPLNINNCIPKGILQKDFLLSIIKMFNLRVIEDPHREKHLIIEPYPDFFNNSDPLDWSNKVDRYGPISLKPMSEVNARYFNFLYEKDADYDNDTYFKRYGKGYADRTHDSGLDFVKDKKDVKIIFAASPLVGALGLDKAVTRICNIDSSGVEERTGSKIRILQAKRLAVASWDFLQDDLTSVINNSSYYGYAGHVDDPGTPQGADLNFGAPAEIYWRPTNPYTAPNVFNAFYSAYLAEITDKDSKLLTCLVLLSPVDIFNLDFGRSIRIDGQLWRLNKLTDYNAIEDDLTQAELLKVINLSY